MSSTSYEWLKQLPSSLLQFEEVPLLGFAPPFPWEEFSDKLKDLFENDQIQVKPGELQSRTKEELYLGLEDSLIAKHITVHPLEGNVCFVMPKETTPTLIAALIKKEDGALDQYDEDFQKSFSQFLTVEVLHTLGLVNFDSGLSYHILSEEALPSEPALCLDIEMVLADKSLHGRLIISTELAHAWKERYSEHQLDLMLSSSIATAVPITVHLEAGKVELTQEEWKGLKSGDFVILDTCTMDPEEGKGRVMLTVNNRPFMRAKFKKGKLKILETPALEVGETMERENHPEEEPEEEEVKFEDEELNLGEEELNLGEEEEPNLEEEEEPSLEEEEEVDLGGEGEIDLSEEEPEESLVEDESMVEEEPVEALPAAEETFEKVSPETLPMNVVVEVGRIQMSLQKLMELQPGNLIELGITPQSGVDLVINGKRVAKGELLSIGETLGVRILEI